MSAQHQARIARLLGLAIACVVVAGCGGNGAPGDAGVDASVIPVSGNGIDLEDSAKLRWRSVDRIAPNVAVVTQSAVSAAGMVDLGGTVTDNMRIYRVNWSNDRGGSGTAQLDGTSTRADWTAASVALQTGENTITVTATDAAGNVAQTQRLVTRSVAPPPPPPTVALDISVLSVPGGTGVPFTVGQPLRQGDVPSGSALVASVPGVQAVIKNRWPDGSAKFAIVSGTVDLSANAWRTIGLSAGSGSPASPISLADLQSSGASASIQFGSFGTASWSAGDWASPTQSWVSGPQMSSWLYRKPIGSDAHLVAWLEVRAYKGGHIEVLPWIENGYLRVASPTSKSGTATFTLNGSQRFSAALNLANHQRAVLASGTTLTHWGGSDPQLSLRHSASYLMASKLVPNYRAVTPTGSELFSRLPASYTPLAQASFPDSMGTAGYHHSIGLLPEWDVAYLSTNADVRAWRGVIISGYAAGRFGVHFRDETTHRALAFSRYPNLVMGEGSGVGSIGASTTNSYTPNASGLSPPSFAQSHHPSMGYMAYLLSGWYYHLEQTQLLATANFLKQQDNTRNFSQGVFESSSGTGITRGAAWAIRTLAQACTITPDDDPLRAEFVASLDANIAYYHGRYVAQANNPLGLIQPYDHYNGSAASAPWEGAVWMDDFFTATFGYLKELNAHSATSQSKLDAFLAWKYRSVVGRLGGSASDNAIAFPWAAQYTVYYAPSNNANFVNGSGPWYANWGDVARAMNLPTSAANGAALVAGYPEEAVGYWGNLMPALSYAVDHAYPGAAEAYARVISASNIATQFSDANHRPVWSVKPRSR